MPSVTKSVADGQGDQLANLIFPERGPISIVYDVSAGAVKIEVSCDKLDDIKANPTNPALLWAELGTLGAPGTPEYLSSNPVTAVRCLPTGGVGAFCVSWG